MDIVMLLKYKLFEDKVLLRGMIDFWSNSYWTLMEYKVSLRLLIIFQILQDDEVTNKVINESNNERGYAIKVRYIIMITHDLAIGP